LDETIAPASVQICATPGEALGILERTRVDAVVADAGDAASEVAEMLHTVYEKWPDTVRILLSEQTDLANVLQSVNRGHVMKFLCKPCLPDELRQAVRRSIEYRAMRMQNTQLNRTLASRNRELQEFNHRLEVEMRERDHGLEVTARKLEQALAGIVNTFLDFMDYCEFDQLGEHSRRVSKITARFAKALGLDEEDSITIETAGLLHDVGKLAAGMKWQNNYREEEKQILIRRHPSAGATLLRKFPGFELIAELVERHHENFDGSGFPSGIAGEKIPLGGRILAIADLCEHLENSSKKGFVSSETIASELQKVAGSRLDPELCKKFVESVLLPAKGGITAHAERHDNIGIRFATRMALDESIRRLHQDRDIRVIQKGAK
jgi:putative nucleotidyltransferase with HDIG domain